MEFEKMGGVSMIAKISVVRRGDEYHAMLGPEHSGGDREEVFFMTGAEIVSLKLRVEEEARRLGIKHVVGLDD